MVEVCIDGIDGLRAARTCGADRVELCAGLIEGGTTPSRGLIEEALALAGPVRVHVLIRPRGGDFVYSADERAVMRRDVAAAVAAGAHGVVVGALRPDGEIDTETVAEVLAAADGVSTTFHRAFDHVADPISALELLVRLGFDRVLTSGQQPTAAEGTPLLRSLVRQAAGRIGILAGGGITEQNVRTVVGAGVAEVHFSAREPVPAAPGDHAVSFGPAERTRTSADRIAAIAAAVR